MCFDANELYIGEFNGKKVRQLYYDQSSVFRKHDAGGQSQRRFERGREETLKHWFKDIVEMINNYQNNREIYLGCNSIYKNRIKKYMNKQTINSITFEKSVSIDDNCLWELTGVSRYENGT